LKAGEEDFDDGPCLNEGGDRNILVQKVKDDPTLKHLRELADKGERGCFWDNGLLMQRCSDTTQGIIENIVVPKSRRSKIMQFAMTSLVTLVIKR